MEIEQLHKEIHQLLEKIVQHSEMFFEDRPSLLELDVILTKLSKTQEKIAVLKYVMEHKESEGKGLSKKIHTERVIETPPIDVVEKEEEIPVREKEEVVVEEETLIEAKEENVEEGDVGSKFQQNPISKLVDAFTLNDRYLYANELFAKDMGAFNELVTNIDKCANFNDANELLNSKKNELNWDEESEFIQGFTNMVERRFQ